MSRKVLIIDSVATNRIVLRVKMKAAQYDVVAFPNCNEADPHVRSDPPDLLLINLSDPTEDRYAFCRQLRSDNATANLGIIALGMDDTAKARFAALDAGADEVLPSPLNDSLLLARVRHLLRRRNLYQEWTMQDGTNASFGWEEERAESLTPAAVLLLSDNPVTSVDLSALLQAGLGHAVRQLPATRVLTSTPPMRVPDLYVIDASDAHNRPDRLMQLVSDLHGCAERRFAGRMVILPRNRPDLAALFLDLGADDVVDTQVAAPEIGLRARNLLRHKARQDRMRERVRDGLTASVTDCLTGLRNRRYAEQHLYRIAQQAHEAHCDYALMMLDIDHFKQINDRYGHAAGDAVLKQLALRLTRCFRKIDLIARMGGEEFLVAMPRTTAQEAALAAERLRHVVDATPFSTGPGGPTVNVTISIGVAVDEPDTPLPPSLGEMLDRADGALYAAKSAGRNKVQLHLAA
ncbi:MAG: diguanylate cyclase [Paracoccaceae bacterium]